MRPALIFKNDDSGETWALPKEVVARDRAEYYVKKDPDTTYQQEFDYVMNDSYEAIDWFRNNMNPEDVIHLFVKLKDSGLDLADKIRNFECSNGEADFPESGV